MFHIYLSSNLGKIDSVTAIARKCSNFPWVTADELRASLEGKDGLGVLSISYNSPRTALNMDIFGTKKNLHLDNLAMTMIEHQSRGARAHHLVLDQLNSSFQSLFGAALAVPVGKTTLGRLFNVLGEPIDNLGPVKAKEHWAIHGSLPSLEEQAPTTEHTSLPSQEKPGLPFICFSEFTIANCVPNSGYGARGLGLYSMRY